MAVRLNNALKNLLCGDAGATPATGNGFGGAMKHFFVDFFPGQQPANPRLAPGVSAIITFSVNGGGVTGGTWDAPADGTVCRLMTEIMKGTVVNAGVPGWARIRLVADLGTTNDTDPRMDCSIGLVGADMPLNPNVDYATVGTLDWLGPIIFDPAKAA